MSGATQGPPETRDPQLIVIIGPTASGKSALGVRLARELGGEVLVCDSTQLYRGFNIGTAKLTAEERAGVAHHLVDVLSPEEEASAGAYREMAVKVLVEVRERGATPILTAGTGLYLRALLEGLADVPQRSEELRERLRESAKREGSGHLHRVLQRLDPGGARKIAAQDEQKVIRAIEVCMIAKRPLSEVHASPRSPLTGWRAVKMGLTPAREALYSRIDARTDAMLARGWLEEVRGLMARGLPERAKAFDFIGYRELRAVLRGHSTMEEARAAIRQATRRYAKRQITWFRRERDVKWMDGFGDEPEIQTRALRWIGDDAGRREAYRARQDESV